MWQATAVTTNGAARGCEALAAPRYELIPIGGMMEQARLLPTGSTITVTCSPKHGIDTSLRLAESLIAEGYHAVPHVAARLIHGNAELQTILDRLARSGLHEVFVVGGDAPAPAGPYRGGRELLETMAAMSPRPEIIGVPAYPEAHASISSADMQGALDVKNELADYAVTQICFDAQVILLWLAAQQRRGLRLPVYIGLPGVIDRMKLMGLAMRIGLGASTRVLRRQSGLASRLFGGSTYRPDELIQALVPAFDTPEGPGLAGFHMNTFNQVEDTLAWVQRTAEDLCQWHGVTKNTELRAATARNTSAGY